MADEKEVDPIKKVVRHLNALKRIFDDMAGEYYDAGEDGKAAAVTDLNSIRYRLHAAALAAYEEHEGGGVQTRGGDR